MQTRAQRSKLQTAPTGCARTLRAVASCLVVLLLAGILTGIRAGAQQDITVSSGVSSNMEIPRGLSRPYREKLMREANAARQRELVSNSDELLQLARELETELHQANPATLSAEQLHKIARIEKLARAVKLKMQYAIAF